MKQNSSENNLLCEYCRMKKIYRGNKRLCKRRDQGALDSKAFGKIEGKGDKKGWSCKNDKF